MAGRRIVKINLLTSSLRLSLIIAGICLLTTHSAFGQWLAGYSDRKLITISSDQVSGSTDLVNFPYLVSFTHNDLRTTGNGGSVTNGNGYDIAFTAGDMVTPLDFELESYTAATGEVVFWVRIPVLSATSNTELYIYYGNGAVSTDQSSTATWNAGYLGVWHMNDVFTDATSNGNNGTNTGTLPTTGVIAGGRGFVRSNGADYITIPGKLGGPTSFTLSAWANVTTPDVFAADIVSIGDNSVLRYDVGNGKVTGVSYDGTDWNTTASASNYSSGWHHVAYTYDNAGNLQQIYIDGSPNGTATTFTTTPAYTWGTNTLIGRHGNSNTNMDFDGTIDEVRISGVAVSSDWIATEYNNQSNPQNFSTFPPEFTSTAVTTATQDILYTYNITCFDDNGDALTITTTTKPAWLTITDNGNGTATLSGTPSNAEVGNHSVVLSVSDGRVEVLQSFTIAVSDVNDSPSDISLTSATVDEGQPANTTVGNLSTSDPDGGDSHTYSLVTGTGDTDNSSFVIMSNQLQTNAVFDFDTKSSYSIRVRTTDDGTGNLTFEKVFTISINDINVAPTDITLSSFNVDEGQAIGTAVGDFTTTDQDDGDGHSYSLITGTGDTDNGSFTIVGAQLRTNAVFNYDTKSSYSIRVRSTDDGTGTLFHEKEFTININNTNLTPTDISLSSTTVDEGQVSGTAVGDFTSIDPDVGDAHTYALVSGSGDADNGSFAIVGSQLRTNAVFDFETKSSYSIRVRTTDDGTGSLFYEKEFTITINDINVAPTDITLSSTDVDEGQTSGTAVGDFTTTDQDDGDGHSYSLVTGTGDTDNGSFTIVGAQLRTNAVFDFDTKSSYSIRVRTTDDGTGSLFYEKEFTITVNDINVAPIDILLSSSDVDEGQASGTAVGNFTTTDQDDGDGHTYSLVSGTGDTDNGSFTIVGAQLRTNALFDFETKSSYSVRVRTTDDGTGNLVYEKVFTITVNDINVAPTDISLSSSNVNEGQASGTAVGDFTTTDQDDGDGHSYSLVTGTGDTDNGSFAIVGTQLRTNAVFDFDTKSSYSIRVRTTDDGTGSLFYEKEFTITINDINVAPTDITLSSSDVDEGQASGTAVGDFTTTDQDDGDGHSYSLVAGTGDTDNASFAIVGTQLRTNAVFDFDTKSSYSIRVRTTDNGTGSLFYEKEFTITLNDINVAPTDILLSSSDVDEGQASGTAVGNFTTTDQDDGDGHSYTLVSGTGDVDNVSFAIVGTQLRTNAVFDFDTKSSYSIRVRTTDNGTGSLFYEKEFTITINDINVAPTDITLSSTDVDEGQTSGTAVGDFTTTDQDDGDGHSYSLVAGTGDTDNASFAIVGTQLRTNAVFDFDTKSSYSIRVRTTDDGTGSLFYEKEFTITINDINVAPTDITLSSSDVDEGQASGTAVGDFTTADQDDGDGHTYSLVSGTGDTDNGSFTIVGAQLRTNALFDFETKSSYSIRVRTTDDGTGSLFYEKEFTITLNDINVAPTDITLSSTDVDEGQTSGTAVGDFTTTDQDDGDGHSYSLVSGTGDTDNASFAIVGTQLSTNAVFDFDTKSSYSIRVRTTDNGTGSLFYEEEFTITVNDVNVAPTDITLSSSTVDEGQASGTAVGDFTTADQDDGDGHSYSLVAGTGDTDNGSFTIVGAQLRTNAVFDFDTKSSYSIRVRTTDDGTGSLFYEKEFTITINDINVAPTDITLSSIDVDEGQTSGTAVGDFTTTDQDDGDGHSYSLVAGTGDTDNASFAIVGTQLRTNAVFDFEMKSSYSIRVRTTDDGTGSLFYEKEFTITINDINVAPTDIALSSSEVDEGQASGTAVGDFTTTDQDDGDGHSYSLVTGTGDTDNASFAIVGTQLRTSAVFDFDTKSSYSIRVRSTDDGTGTLFHEKEFTITINNINLTPTDISLSPTTVDEGQVSGTAVGDFASVDPDAGDAHAYTLVSGSGDADNGSFTIIGSQLRTNAVFDFETKSSYSIRVRTTDDGTGSLFYEKEFTITINDINVAPTDITLSSSDVDEGQASGIAVGDFTTTDQDDGDGHSYSLVTGTGDTDNGSFTIVGTQLRTNALFDFETKSSYSIRVRTTDDGTGTLFFEEEFIITINDVNVAPTDITLSNTNVDEGQATGTVIGDFTTTDQDDGDLHSYTLVAGSGDIDNGSFAIVGNQLQTNAVLDYDLKSSYSIRVRTTDNGTGSLSFDKIFTVTLNNINFTPTDIALSSTNVNEGQAAGAAVGNFSTSDPDAGDVHTYSLVAGAGDSDNSSFVIVANQLRTDANLNYETQSSYSIRVRSTDNGAGTLYFEKVFTITAIDQNDAPTDLSLSSTNINEGLPIGTTVGTLSATDEDSGDAHSYSLVSGGGSADNSHFQIAGNLLQSNSVFNFEIQNSYLIRIRATDNGTGNLYYEKALIITINNQNDAPSDISLSATTINEELPVGTVVGILSSTDQDLGDAHTYSLVTGAGSADNSRFQIAGDELQTNAVLDYELQSSYQIRVRTTDDGSGNLYYEKAFTITAIDQNDPPTDIILSNSTVNEGQAIGTLVGTLSTTDDDLANSHTYILVSGGGSADNTKFQIVGNELQTNAVLDFETQNSFSVRIRTTDNGTGSLSYEEVFVLSAVNENDPPTDITLSSTTVMEEQSGGTLVGILSASDPDIGDSHTYSLASGTGDTDNSSFQIVGNELQTSGVLDYESQFSYQVRIRTTDNGSGNLYFEESFTITLIDRNDPPSDINLSNNSVIEGQASGSSIGNLSTDDEDSGDSHTYTLVSGAGSNDNSSFQIVANSLRINTVPDYEVQNSYSVRIRTTDNGTGSLSYEEIFTISVVDQNEMPTDISLTSTSVDEGLPAGSLVGVLSTADEDIGDAHNYSLVLGSGSADNESFQIVGDELQTNVILDFESQTSYQIRIRSTDNGTGNLFYDKAFTINAIDENDSPTDITISSTTVNEEQPSGTLVGLLTATDPDAGDAHTFTLVGGSGSEDNALFTILGAELRTGAVLDFETRENYTIRLRATDNGTGNLYFEKGFTISALDVNDAPAAIILSNNTVGEGLPVGTLVGILSTDDEDGADSHMYTLVSGSGSDDNSSFLISGDELLINEVMDFETKSTYLIRIRSTDNGSGNLFFEETFTITVTDQNSAPTDLKLSNSGIDENQITGSLIGTLSTIDDDSGDMHTYSLVSGTGDEGNSNFQIAGNELQAATGFDFETQSSYSVRIRTTDNGTGNLSYEEVFTITINDINEAPEFTSTPVRNISVNASYFYAITTNDQDAGSTLEITSMNPLPAWLSLTDNSDGTATLSGTPMQADIGSYEITLSVSDGMLQAEQVYTLEVGMSLIAPMAIDDELILNEDEDGSINVLDNDENQGGQTLILSLMSTITPNGTASLTNNGDLAYTPDPDFYGMDSVLYQVDIQGEPGYSSIARVLITVIGVNDSPVVEDRVINISESGPVEVCIPVSDIDSEECMLTEILGSDEALPFSDWDGEQLCFTYEPPAGHELEENLNCVICDNGSPVACDTASLTLVYDLEEILQITEGISPNGDGLNDTWIIHGIEFYPQNTVKIYNRYGNIVYKAENYNNNTVVWDGSVNRGLNLGNKVPSGTYFFVLEAPDLKNGITGYIVVN